MHGWSIDGVKKFAKSQQVTGFRSAQSLLGPELPKKNHLNLLLLEAGKWIQVSWCLGAGVCCIISLYQEANDCALDFDFTGLDQHSLISSERLTLIGSLLCAWCFPEPSSRQHVVEFSQQPVGMNSYLCLADENTESWEVDITLWGHTASRWLNQNSDLDPPASRLYFILGVTPIF